MFYLFLPKSVYFYFLILLTNSSNRMWDRSDERWNIGFLEHEKLFFVIFLRVVASHHVLLKPIECTTEWNPNVNCGLGLIIMYQH